jgi:hypothetical protein
VERVDPLLRCSNCGGAGGAERVHHKRHAATTTFGDGVHLPHHDKSGQWTRWYRMAIPHAEQLYADYLAERERR